MSHRIGCSIYSVILPHRNSVEIPPFFDSQALAILSERAYERQTNMWATSVALPLLNAGAWQWWS